VDTVTPHQLAAIERMRQQMHEEALEERAKTHDVPRCRCGVAIGLQAMLCARCQARRNNRARVEQRFEAWRKRA
jgi:hypothetical protein